MKQRNNFKGSRGSSRGGGDRRGGNNDREMHTATCAQCSGVAEVPFKPTGNKPVLCRNCFSSKRGGNSEQKDRRGRNDYSSNRDRKPAPSVDIAKLEERINSLHKKLDSIIKALDIKEPFESKDVFRAPDEEVKPKKPKRNAVKKGDLKKAVNKAFLRDK